MYFIFTYVARRQKIAEFVNDWLLFHLFCSGKHYRSVHLKKKEKNENVHIKPGKYEANVYRLMWFDD
jgi:hypothetical protein